MIKQVIDIEGYWKVIVFWNVNYGLFDIVEHELKKTGLSNAAIERVKMMMEEEAKAVTCSNERKHLSVIAFNHHSSEADYINSIVHEAEHVKQAMLRTYLVDDEGEPPAYTIGYLVMKMWKVFSNYIACFC